MQSRAGVAIWLCLLLLLSGGAAGQKPSAPGNPETQERPGRVFRITSEAVRLDVFVTDRRGNPIPDLTADDFEVLRNGQPQEILTCSRVVMPERADKSRRVPGNAPSPETGPQLDPGINKRWISIVVNDLRMSFEDIAHVRDQLQKFVKEIGPYDQVSIMQVSGGSGVLLPFTSDKKLLGHLIDKIRFQLRGFGFCGG